MSLSLDNTQLVVSLHADYASAQDLVTATAPLRFDFADFLTTGTGLDQADRMFADTRTIPASSSDELDLTGSLTDAFGNYLSFVKIKTLIIRNKSTTAGYRLIVGGGGASFPWEGWTPEPGSHYYVGPGGIDVKHDPSLAGMPVEVGTNDAVLSIENPNAGSVSYDIVIIGTSA